MKGKLMDASINLIACISLLDKLYIIISHPKF